MDNQDLPNRFRLRFRARQPPLTKTRRSLIWLHAEPLLCARSTGAHLAREIAAQERKARHFNG
jgi:hypothetical protein